MNGNKPNKAILSIASSLSHPDGLTRLNAPDWTSNRFAWERYVPEAIRANWGELSEESRLVSYICAVESLSSDDGFGG